MKRPKTLRESTLSRSRTTKSYLFSDSHRPPRAFERSAEADDQQTEDGVSDHHLVRRIAAYDFVSTQTPLLDEEDPALEESLRAGATTSGEDSANRRFNLTVCAFIPHEKVSVAILRVFSFWH